MKKFCAIVLAGLALVTLNGCGPWQITDNVEMTDGGPLGRHFDAWQKEDEQARQDLAPTIKRYWRDEKKKWPTFRRSTSAAEIYAQDEEVRKVGTKEAAGE